MRAFIHCLLIVYISAFLTVNTYAASKTAPPDASMREEGKGNAASNTLLHPIPAPSLDNEESSSLSLTGAAISPIVKCKVFVLDCGQGNAVIAKYGNQTMVFDAGRTASLQFVKYEDDHGGESLTDISYQIRETTTPLRSVEIDLGRYTSSKKPYHKNNDEIYKETFAKAFKDFVKGDLKAVFVSHADADHYNLIAEYKLMPQAFVVAGNHSLYDAGFREHLENKAIIMTKGKDYKKGSSREQVKYYNDALEAHNFEGKDNTPKVRVLSVNTDRSGEDKAGPKNSDSMIVRISQRHSMLITGDAFGVTWDDAIKVEKSITRKILSDILPGWDTKIYRLIVKYMGEHLKADVLLIAHHGAKTHGSTSKKVLWQVKPKVCLISAGFQYSHPTSEVIEDLLLPYYHTTPYRTDPHFITFFRGKKMVSLMTDAPIFTTIDNGVLTVDLMRDILTLRVARDFNPTPRPSLTSKTLEGKDVRLDLDLVSDRSFFDKTTVIRNNNQNPLFRARIFGPDIFFNKKEEYFYRLGDTYLKLQLIEREDKELMREIKPGGSFELVSIDIERSISSLAEWFERYPNCDESVEVQSQGVYRSAEIMAKALKLSPQVLKNLKKIERMSKGSSSSSRKAPAKTTYGPDGASSSSLASAAPPPSSSPAASIVTLATVEAAAKAAEKLEEKARETREKADRTRKQVDIDAATAVEEQARIARDHVNKLTAVD
jgi:hypothetical protein